jgi:hypothetical protein
VVDRSDPPPLERHRAVGEDRVGDAVLLREARRLLDRRARDRDDCNVPSPERREPRHALDAPRPARFEERDDAPLLARLLPADPRAAVERRRGPAREILVEERLAARERDGEERQGTGQGRADCSPNSTHESR